MSNPKVFGGRYVQGSLMYDTGSQSACRGKDEQTSKAVIIVRETAESSGPFFKDAEKGSPDVVLWTGSSGKDYITVVDERGWRSAAPPQNKDDVTMERVWKGLFAGAFVALVLTKWGG